MTLTLTLKRGFFPLIGIGTDDGDIDPGELLELAASGRIGPPPPSSPPVADIIDDDEDDEGGVGTGI